MQSYKGVFITLEGADGAGKSTQLQHILSHLKDLSHSVVETREPGGTELANQIRSLFKGNSMSKETEVLLLNAARRDHLEKVIIPALEQGKIVVCDRFYDSTYAYQGGLKGMEEDQLKIIEDFTQNGLEPDITLYFDVDLQTSKSRREKRGENSDRLEEEMDKNFNQMRNVFIKRSTNSTRISVIDGSLDVESVKRDTLQIIDKRLKEVLSKKKTRTCKI